MIHASAPGRVGIIGNPSDIYGGTVISCAIRDRAEVFIKEADGVILDIGGHVTEVRSRDDLVFGDALPYLDIAKAVWKYLTGDDNRYMQDFEIDTACGFHLRTETTIPMRAGCGGSTALLVAILAGILAHFSIRPTRYHIAEMSRHIERVILGVDCGFQDQYMVVFGGINCIDCRDKQWGWERDDGPYATVEPLVENLGDDDLMPFVLANTGKRQGTSGTYHGPPRQRWENGEKEMVDGIARIAELARLGKRALIEQDWSALAELMNENCAISTQLFGISDVNDELIQAALKHGALGAKLAGAGGGGTIIALHTDPRYLADKLRQHDIQRIIPMSPRQRGLQVEIY
jgi:galactokinase/mevalonate kinase-like predicted kinase